MTHVITRACCNDAACVAVCPKNSIHPRPDDPGFAAAEMLRIDPATCIDCGACIEVCPVGAIVPDHRLGSHAVDYLELNKQYFETRSYEAVGFQERTPAYATASMTVAVIGSGPASMYAVEHLLERLTPDSEVHVYERLPTPWGLVRNGVAPDHQDTKQVSRAFERTVADPRVRLHLNVEVGRDVTHEDLRLHHHAVVYGLGAADPRPLGIPGEDLPGSIPGADLVAWYNGHPDFRDLEVPLASRRAVVIGNGNVALDVARILAVGHQDTDESDIADHALEALRSSELEEIVVIGRRGPAEAAYTSPELLSLLNHPDIDVHVGPLATPPSVATGFKEALVRRATAGEFASRSGGARRRVVLRYGLSPKAILGSSRVSGLTVAHNVLKVENDVVRALPTDQSEDIACGLVVHAVGYRARPLPGLPFDDAAGLIPHAAGRVVDGERPVRGTYVVGWAKRGPSGVIGTNKTCAEETVQALIEDQLAGHLGAPERPAADLRLPDHALDIGAWRRIDSHEQEGGRVASRPRSKLTDRPALLQVARSIADR